MKRLALILASLFFLGVSPAPAARQTESHVEINSRITFEFCWLHQAWFVRIGSRAVCSVHDHCHYGQATITFDQLTQVVRVMAGSRVFVEPRH